MSLNKTIADFTTPSSDQFFDDRLLQNFTFENESDECFYEPQPYLTGKFYLTTVCGTCVALVGFFNNCLLLNVLIKSALIRTHVFFLFILAICDIIAGISYVLLLSTQILFDYAEWVFLYKIWHKNVRWIFTLTNVTLTVSALMIVSASAERFLATLKWMKHSSCSRRDRWLITFAAICFAALSKGVVFWEVEVVRNENCSGFGEYVLTLSAIARDPTYKTVNSLWFRHVAHVFLPFMIILLLNGAILFHLKRNPLELQSALISLTLGELARQRKRSVRAATRMLAAVVTTYLMSNLLNVVISIWEHINKDYLLEQRKFYTFAADIISLLTVLTGCVRMPLYCAANKQLRKEIFAVLRKWGRGGKMIGAPWKLFLRASEKKEDLIKMENGKSGKRMSGSHEADTLLNGCSDKS